MEVMFVEGRSDLKLSRDFMKEILEKVKGKTVGLATTVQYIDQLRELKEYLVRNGVKVYESKSKFGKYPCQVLGCSVIKYNTDIVLYLGTGKFHPLGLALENDSEVVIANPESETVSVLSKDEVEKYKLKIRVNKELVKRAKKIGILVSTKPGQNKLEDAIRLKKKLESEGKEAYILMFDTLNFDELDNFPDFEAYINTACPRLFDDSEKFNKPIVNISHYEENNY